MLLFLSFSHTQIYIFSYFLFLLFLSNTLYNWYLIMRYNTNTNNSTTTNCSNNSRSIRWKRKRWSWWQEECFTRRHRWLPRPKRDCNFRVSPRLFRYVKSSSEWNRGVMFSLFHSMKLEFYVWIWASLAVHPALYNMIFTHSRLNDSIWQVLDSIRFLKDGGSIDYK